MSTGGGWRRSGLTASVFAVVSWIGAALYVALHSGFGKGDLWAFALWCALAGVAAILPLHIFGRVTATWSSSITLLVAACSAVVLATAITYSVSLILGPWTRAFSFPIFLCWVGGASAAFLSSVVLGDRRLWPFACALWPTTIGAVLLSVRLATPAELPELVVLAAPGASAAEVQAVWELFSVPPTATPRNYNPEGIRTVARVAQGDSVGVRVTFHPGTDPARRAAVVARVIASSLVAKVREVTEDAEGRVHETVLKDVQP